VADADVVVTLGLEPDWRVEHLAPPLLGEQAALVQIDSRAEDLARTGPAAVALFADEARAAAALARGARRRAWPEWLDRLRTARQEWLLDLAQGEDEVDGAVHPCALAAAVAAAVSRHDAHVVIDGGHVGKWAKALVRAERPGRVWRLKGALAAIGHGLPSAIALALSDPGRPTLLMTGDGSFGYGFLELETAIAEQLRVTCVVAVDGAWGSVYTSQLAAHGGSVGTRLSRTPFDELARALGAYGERVTRAAALDDALERALARGGPAVLAVDSATVPSPAVYPRTTRYA
jgi:acetolactate synthase-1/2/3 large subunit